MATETSRRGLARETGRGLRFPESAMATPRRAPDYFQQLSWQDLQCGLLVACMLWEENARALVMRYGDRAEGDRLVRAAEPPPSRRATQAWRRDGSLTGKYGTEPRGQKAPQSTAHGISRSR